MAKNFTNSQSSIPSPQSPVPSFSFIIPVKPGGHVSALEALRRIDASAFRFEVLVAEGKTPSQQRNQAAYQSQGDILYFLDDDSQLPQEALEWCLAAFEEHVVAVVGGPSLTPGDDAPLQQLFGLSLSSPFGAGGVRNRYRAVGLPRETSEKELILCNMAFRREDFVSFGGFDERLYPNEENELMDRIHAAGHKLVHVPEMAVYRSQRPTLKAFARQMFAYGRGRAQQTLIAGMGTLLGFAPLLFAVYLISLPIALIWPYWGLPLLAYLLLAAFFSLLAVAASGHIYSAALLLIYPLMHISNGIGLISGFIGGRPQPVARGVVHIRLLKTFEQTEW
ncbi:MAG TPA: glycosyltransferase family 2 protein [Deltaproteobacteria bacterium]|nr:glycosyltransferase family 2 protein [Deltaproteobacteria bacterium]